MRKTLAAIAATLILSSCASGEKRTQDRPIPDIKIATTQLQQPEPLPNLDGTDDVALLRNHVAVAYIAHSLTDQVTALVCGLMSQGGFTVNGAAPSPPAWCWATKEAEPVDNTGH